MKEQGKVEGLKSRRNNFMYDLHSTRQILHSLVILNFML